MLVLCWLVCIQSADRLAWPSPRICYTCAGISLLWTLLQNGHEALGGDPIAKRVIIVCPTSLVSNWDSECAKWLKVSLRLDTLSS